MDSIRVAMDIRAAPLLLLLASCHAVEPTPGVFSLCENVWFAGDTYKLDKNVKTGGQTDFGYPIKKCSNADFYCIKFPFPFAIRKDLKFKPESITIENLDITFIQKGDTTNISVHENQKYPTDYVIDYKPDEGVMKMTTTANGDVREYRRCHGKFTVEDLKKIS